MGPESGLRDRSSGPSTAYPDRRGSAVASPILPATSPGPERSLVARRGLEPRCSGWKPDTSPSMLTRHEGWLAVRRSRRANRRQSVLPESKNGSCPGVAPCSLVLQASALLRELDSRLCLLCWPYLNGMPSVARVRTTHPRVARSFFAKASKGILRSRASSEGWSRRHASHVLSPGSKPGDSTPSSSSRS